AGIVPSLVALEGALCGGAQRTDERAKRDENRLHAALSAAPWRSSRRRPTIASASFSTVQLMFASGARKKRCSTAEIELAGQPKRKSQALSSCRNATRSRPKR